MTEQMNVPKLRFGEFDGEYIDTTLEDLTKKKISYGIVQAGPHIPNGMPYIKSTNLNKELCLDDLERTSDEIAKSYQRSEVVPEDIVFSLRGNIGATRIVPETIPVANLTQGTARLSIRDNFSNVYVNYCLGTRKAYKRVNSVSKGSTFQEISLADLRKVKITHSVDIKEQQKIASFLSKVDEKISLLTEKKDKLAEYKKGVMQQLFNGSFQEQDGQLTFIPPTLRFKADDGSEFPDWEEKTFGRVARFINGKAYKQTELQDSGKYKVLRVGNFFTSSHWYYSDLELHEDKYCDNGDLLYAWSASFGPRVWNGDKTIYHYHIWKVVNNEAATKEFLYIMLDWETEMMKARSANGFALLHITKGVIESWGIKLPSIEEQTKIANFLSSIDQKIDLTKSELEKAQDWKKGLLQQMFV